MKVTLITLTSLLVSTAISSTSALAAASSAGASVSTASIDLVGLPLSSSSAPKSSLVVTSEKDEKRLAEPSQEERTLARETGIYWKQFAGNHDELTAKINSIKGAGLTALKKAAEELAKELSSKEKSEDKIAASRMALASFNHGEAPFTNKGKNAAALTMTLFVNNKREVLPYFDVLGLSNAKTPESLTSLITAYETVLSAFEKAHTDNLALKTKHTKIII